MSDYSTDANRTNTHEEQDTFGTFMFTISAKWATLVSAVSIDTTRTASSARLRGRNSRADFVSYLTTPHTSEDHREPSVNQSLHTGLSRLTVSISEINPESPTGHSAKPVRRQTRYSLWFVPVLSNRGTNRHTPRAQHRRKHRAATLPTTATNEQRLFRAHWKTRLKRGGRTRSHPSCRPRLVVLWRWRRRSVAVRSHQLLCSALLLADAIRSEVKLKTEPPQSVSVCV